MAQDKATPGKLMTSPERNSIVKIVRERFKVFRRHAKQTRNELRVEIFERIQAENERKVEAAKKDMAKIEERAKKLAEDAQAVVAKHRANGLELGGARIEDKLHYVNGDHRQTENRKEITTWKTEKAVSVTVNNGWVVKGVDRQVEREFRKLEREYGLGELAMAKKEQELVEEIVLGGVKSDEAQAFLGKVPTLEVLPDPSAVVARLGA